VVFDREVYGSLGSLKSMAQIVTLYIAGHDFDYANYKRLKLLARLVKRHWSRLMVLTSRKVLVYWLSAAFVALYGLCQIIGTDRVTLPI